MAKPSALSTGDRIAYTQAFCKRIGGRGTAQRRGTIVATRCGCSDDGGSANV